LILGLPEGWFISRIQTYKPDIMNDDYALYIRIQNQEQAFDSIFNIEEFDWDTYIKKVSEKIEQSNS
jgi:hypothetical protein